jgi:putative ABC transport system substrate-binding protein
MSSCLQRREFIAGLGGAAAWPVAARAQQRPIPTIGFLVNSPAPLAALSAELSKRLMEVGYVEGQNVKVEYRLAGDEIFEHHREFAADLVRRQVAVILARGAGAALAAKTVTSSIPIVFYEIGSIDPEKLGLVASVSKSLGPMLPVSVLSMLPSRGSSCCASSFLPQQRSHTCLAVRAGSPSERRGQS